MPRTARIKNEAGIYHIMVRSISDVALFKNNKDKDKYLQLIKKYQEIFLFKVYSYCLMTTHGHIIIDCCGADISKIMKSINQCYSAYFNKKYGRCGHVFQDRFKSKLVDNDRYLIALSAYIHNNPRDINTYRNHIEKYKYSSLGIYLGLAVDKLDIIDIDFILKHFSSDKTRARKLYLDFLNRVSNQENEIDVEFENEGSECRNERMILLRNLPADKVINFVARYTNTNFDIHVKFNHKHAELRSLCVLIMRSLCNMSFKDICAAIGNITISSLWRLYEKGYSLLTSNSNYRNLLRNCIAEYSAV